MNVIGADGLCGSNFVVTPISLHELTCGLKQCIEINIIKESFEYQIWWSGIKHALRNTDMNMNR